MIRFRRTFSVLLLAACVSMMACTAQASAPEVPTLVTAAPRPPLYDNLGSYRVPITTSSSDAQKYFDQGLTLSYAFNHAEAIRAFRQAAEIDPFCAMCYWGTAFALGPNMNAPITEAAAKEAWKAIEQARQVAGGATERERAYIDALAQRYEHPDPGRILHGQLVQHDFLQLSRVISRASEPAAGRPRARANTRARLALGGSSDLGNVRPAHSPAFGCLFAI